jgi:hypothetical protein
MKLLGMIPACVSCLAWNSAHKQPVALVSRSDFVRQVRLGSGLMSSRVPVLVYTTGSPEAADCVSSEMAIK